MPNEILQLTAAESRRWGDDDGEDEGAAFRRETREKVIRGCSKGRTVEILDADGTVLDALTCEDEDLGEPAS